MEKTICMIAAFAAALMSSTPALEAQEPVVLPSAQPAPQPEPRWGVRLQGDLSVPSDGLGMYGNGGGATGGVVYRQPVYRGLYVEPGVMLYYNTFSVDNYMEGDLPYDGTIRNFGIRIPVNIGYRFMINDSVQLSLFTGPWFNFNVSMRQYANPNFEGAPPKNSKNLFDYGWHRFDAQWGFGVTATFSGRYVIGVSAGVGSKALVSKTFSEHKSSLRRNTFSITLGYNF